LRTAEKEVAAILIGQNTICRMSLLPYPTQSDAPRNCARNRNLTVCVSARQGSSISVDGIRDNRPDPLQMERRAACPELAEGSSPVVLLASTTRQNPRL
jgi:hypothetical protein